jgi:hypothetical protein
VSNLLTKIQQLVDSGKIRISEHGYDELADDGIFVIEVVSDVNENSHYYQVCA